MQKITPFLWFDGNAEEAIDFYTSIFKNSKVVSVSRMEDGKALGATFQIEGQEFFALNGGPQFQFTPAISFFVNCETQAEVDEFWEKLSEGGEKQRCGWLKDKFGLSWQIVPSVLGKMLGNKEAGNSKKAFEAMMTMDKLDIKRLEEAYAEK